MELTWMSWIVFSYHIFLTARLNHLVIWLKEQSLHRLRVSLVAMVASENIATKDVMFRLTCVRHIRRDYIVSKLVQVDRQLA